MINKDQLQNELIVIKHHIEDAMIGLKENDPNYAMRSLEDINEVVDRLSKFITPNQKKEIDRIASEMPEI